MTAPNQLPHAIFSGALGDNATGAWYPAQAVLSDGFVTLWVASSAGWAQQFSVPAGEVTAKSAAQRITLQVRGQSYPILADPAAVNRALGLYAVDAVGHVIDLPGVNVASSVGRGVNQAAAARAFQGGGGAEFLTAMRFSGARVSRLGYGAIAAIGCGGGLLAVVLVVVITMLALSL